MTSTREARKWYATAQSRGIGDLRGQLSGRRTQTFAGKSILKVMRGVVSFAGGGDIHPSQKALAERSGVSKRTVELVQDWLIENGWLRVTAPAVVGVKGPTLKTRIPKEETEVIDPKVVEARVVEATAKPVPAKRYVQVHVPGSMNPNEYQYVEVAESALRFIGLARQVRDEQRAVNKTAIITGRVRTPGGESVTTRTSMPDPSGRIAAEQRRRRDIENGVFSVPGPAWAVPDFD